MMFIMGTSSETNISVITSAFRMSEKEITRDQFLAVMGTDPSTVGDSSGTGEPVQHINWYHALAFCNLLSLEEGLTPVYAVTGVDFTTLTYGEVPTESNGYLGSGINTTGYTKGYAGSLETGGAQVYIGAGIGHQPILMIP